MVGDRQLPWWMDFGDGSKSTTEEYLGRKRIWGLAAPIMIPLLIIGSRLMVWLGIDRNSAALIAVPIFLPLSVYLSSRMAKRLWPALLRKAEDDAEARRQSQSN